MQCPILLAFRKRLSNRGYTDIHIKQARYHCGSVKKDFYIVTACEPLTKTIVSGEFHVITLYYLMR